MLLYDDIFKIPMEERRVVMLQSGGMESCFVACLLSKAGYEIHHVFIDYGQNALENERNSVNRIVNEYGGTLHTVKLDMPWLKEATVLNSGDEVLNCEVEDPTLIAVHTGVYVPMRNTIFLSIASSLADSLKIPYIACGLDGYQDDAGRPLSGAPDKHTQYAIDLERALQEGSALKHVEGEYIQLITPTMNKAKLQTISQGMQIGCDFSLSWSCYNGTEKPCGKCGPCVDRKNQFKAIGLEDPLKYME